MNEQMLDAADADSVREDAACEWKLPPSRADVHTTARLEFAGRAVQLPGVEVLLHGDRLTVFVPGLRSPAADAVFAIEGEVYAAYPSACLNLEVEAASAALSAAA
ncbi:MAG: hypothetical protein ACO1SX_25385 [Actinomycetota bacterium]